MSSSPDWTSTMSLTSPLDWNAVRSHFPVLEDWAHLNSAAFGPLPAQTVEAMNRHLAARNENASLDFVNWFDRLDCVRGKVATLIGAEASDIAFCPNAGVGLSWLLRGIEWRSGDEILTLEHEFPNNLYAPMVLPDRGISVRPLAPPQGRFDPDLILDALGPRSRLVLLSSVNYSNGLRAPLQELGRELRRRGVLFCVDATQSVGVLRLDLREVPVDYLVVHGYKWLVAPPGAAFVYVPERTRAWLPPTVVSWRSHHAWRDFERLHHGPPVFPSEASLYEGGVQCFPVLFGLEASLDLILSCGPDAIEQRALTLANHCVEILRGHGGQSLPSQPCDSPIVSAVLPGYDPDRLRHRFVARKVAVSFRQGNLRVSTHFFNNRDDLCRFSDALAA